MIIYQGTWQEKDKWIVEHAVTIMSGKLGSYLDMDPELAFGKVFFINPVLYATNNARGYWGYTSGRQMWLVRGKVSEALVLHEFGHIANYEAEKAVGKSKSPQMMLWKHGIWTKDGELVSGRVNNVYRRNNGLLAQDNGFLSDDWKTGGQIHPINMREGNTPKEDWCDTFMAAMLDKLADNPAGRARREFVKCMVVSWLIKSSGVPTIRKSN